MRQGADTHERLVHEEEIEGSSDRAFGWVFAGVFGLIGLWPVVWGRPPRAWSLGVAFVFLVLAFVWPRGLAPLNRLWRRVGLILHAVVHPVVMAGVFFTTVAPIGLIMRGLGKDPLRLRFDRTARTYWIERRPPGPAPDTMDRQF